MLFCNFSISKSKYIVVKWNNFWSAFFLPYCRSHLPIKLGASLHPVTNIWGACLHPVASVWGARLHPVASVWGVSLHPVNSLWGASLHPVGSVWGASRHPVASVWGANRHPVASAGLVIGFSILIAVINMPFVNQFECCAFVICTEFFV